MDAQPHQITDSRATSPRRDTRTLLPSWDKNDNNAHWTALAPDSGEHEHSGEHNTSTSTTAERTPPPQPRSHRRGEGSRSGLSIAPMIRRLGRGRSCDLTSSLNSVELMTSSQSSGIVKGAGFCAVLMRCSCDDACRNDGMVHIGRISVIG